MSEPESTPPRIFRLQDVTKRLREVLLPVTAKQFWLRAQLVPEKTRSSGGHYFGQLVEKDDKGRDVAKIRVMIWKNDVERIEDTLRTRGEDHLQILRRGGDICASCSVRFHPIFGLSLTIWDLDPDLGESQIERARRLILEALQRDGLLDRNKERSVPVAPLKVGLITATDSAAYADFLRTLTTSGFAFQIVHVAAAVQGVATVRSVVAAINRLENESLDLICIIRGGGSPLDLVWFDNEEIARAVVNCRVPVWVGIGHEIDFGVLDHIAHTSHKTPTAVAEALVAQLRDVHNRLMSARERLEDSLNRAVDLAERRLAQSENGFRQGTRKHLLIQTERFERYLSRLETELAQQAEKYGRRFQEAVTRLAERTRAIVEEHAARLITVGQAILRSTDHRQQRAAEKLKRSFTGLQQGGRKHLSLSDGRLRHTLERLRGVADRQIGHRATALASRQVQIVAKASAAIATASQAVAWRGRALHQTEAAVSRIEAELRRRALRIGLETYEARRSMAEARLSEKQKRLDALSPERLLERGYSVSRTGDGRLIRSVADVQVGEIIHTQVRDGIVQSRVEESHG